MVSVWVIFLFWHCEVLMQLCEVTLNRKERGKKKKLFQILLLLLLLLLLLFFFFLLKIFKDPLRSWSQL